MATNTDAQTEERKKPLNEVPAPSNTTEGSKIELEVRRVEFNIYFDGTWNSKFNSNWYNDSDWYKDEIYIVEGKRYKDHDDRLPTEKSMRKMYKADETSFARAPTSVDRMHRAAMTADPYIIPLYADGSGTTTPSDNPYLLDNVNDYKGSKDVMKDDTLAGGGLGLGPTGVYTKMETMCQQIQVKLDKVSNLSDSPLYIVMFNVYGFSRGSATARMFINRIIKQQKNKKFKKLLDLTDYAVMVKFVGLFDTVSSIGDDHSDDVKEDEQGLDYSYKSDLHEEAKTLPSDSLDFAQGVITGKIVHIVAGHEFRQKFSVTSIRQAVERGYGFEVMLPGNHTDIGDGKSTEKKFDEITRAWKLSGDRDKKTILQHKSWSILNLATTPVKALVGSASPVIKDQRNMEKAMNEVSLEKSMQILINQGWFVNAPATSATAERKEIWIEKNGSHKKLEVNRVLSQDYPKVPAWIMIEIIKEMGEYRLIDGLMAKYTIETTKDAKLEEIYDDLHEQVMAKWAKESNSSVSNKTNKKSLFYQTNLFDNINKDRTGYISGSIINNNQHLQTYVTVRNIDTRNTMFNKYLQWSSQVEQGASKEFIPVGIPRIDPNTCEFYRRVISG